MDLKKLKEPFRSDDIEWRVQSSGLKKDGTPWAKVLAYVTNRAIMDRLDEVCGPENWENQFKDAPGGGIMCGISILINEERWVGKWDGAEQTNIEAVKGGLSSAMKRAAVQWGIGRYLYNLEATWAVINMTDGRYSDKIKRTDGDVWFKWDPPSLPYWAIPAESDEDKAKMLWTTLDTTCREHLSGLTPAEKTEFFAKHLFDKQAISEVCKREMVEDRR